MLPGMGMMGMIGKGGATALSIAISTSQNNVNLFTLAGSPTSSGTYTFTINSGVIIGSTSTATAALVSGTFPTGSVVNLINNGAVYGKEGAGGIDGGGNGSAAGNAISLSNNITITNGSGSIFGGGGGGGGSYTANPDFNGENAPGGGAPGGNGQGFGNQAGASPGSGDAYGGVSGSGGAWGTAGNASTGAGGAAGKAIALNGKTVTWVSGNDSTHIKGAVS